MKLLMKPVTIFGRKEKFSKYSVKLFLIVEFFYTYVVFIHNYNMLTKSNHEIIGLESKLKRTIILIMHLITYFVVLLWLQQ